MKTLDRRLVPGDQRDGEQLGQVAPLGGEQHEERRQHGPPPGDVLGLRDELLARRPAGGCAPRGPGCTRRPGTAPARRAGRRLGQERRRVPEQHRHRGLHRERGADAQPDQDRPVPGGQHQGREEGLVGQLDDEDRAEGEHEGGEVHCQPSLAPTSARLSSRWSRSRADPARGRRRPVDRGPRRRHGAGARRGAGALSGGRHPARRRARPGQHLDDRAIEGVRGAHDVVVLRLRGDHTPSSRETFTGISTRRRAPTWSRGQRGPLDRAAADADRRGLPEDRAAHLGRVVRRPPAPGRCGPDAPSS